jgi:alcohol dehydrogenase class IV
VSAFRHVDVARTIVFGADAVSEAEDLIGSGFTLLATRRALELAPELAERAGEVVMVRKGYVEEIAAELRGQVQGEHLVAFGGGRVIDVGKALAAADPPRRLTAIPTTVSAAEMTGRHRHARGVPADTPHARPAVIVNDPDLSASQPAKELAASSANALGHALVAMLSDRGSPISDVIAAEAIWRLQSGWTEDEPERTSVALGAMLAGWAVDLTGIGLHHVLAQTAVRTVKVGHAGANAALLPSTLEAMRARSPGVIESLDGDAAALAARLRTLAGPSPLHLLATDEELLERTVAAAEERPELGRPEPRPEREELRAIYEAAAR